MRAWYEKSDSHAADNNLVKKKTFIFRIRFLPNHKAISWQFSYQLNIADYSVYYPKINELSLP